MKTNATKETLEMALKNINVKYEGNVTFNRFDVHRNRINFTLRVSNSRGPGAKVSRLMGKERHTCSACWHAHGDFFDAIFKLDEKAWIFAAHVGTMEGPKDNWQDFNIGSMIYPMYFSDSCDCGGR
jgi:hypothetical protein